MANSYILTDSDEGKILPRLQTLRWVKSSPVTDTQAFDNRQMQEEDYPNYTLIKEYQKFNIATDSILIQITSNYSVRNVILIDETTLLETDLTDAVANKSTAWTQKTSWNSSLYGILLVENKTIYTTLLSGIYHLRLELNEESSAESGNNILEYTSNTFQVGTYSDLPKLTWTHSEIGLRKGIYFSGEETFMSRLGDRYCIYTPAIDMQLNDSWNKVLTLLDADSKFYVVMELSKMPRYLLEKLNCILQVDTIFINEEAYQVEAGIESQIIGDDMILTSVYKGRLKWRKKGYEKYRDFEAVSEIETFRILINEDGDMAEINDAGDIGLYDD